MPDLSDFQRGQIVGAHMAGASITETARILGVSRNTVSKVITAFEREGKTYSAKHRSGRKSKLSESIAVPAGGAGGEIAPPSFEDLGKIKIFRAVRRKYLGKTIVFWAAI